MNLYLFNIYFIYFLIKPNTPHQNFVKLILLYLLKLNYPKQYDVTKFIPIV